MRETLDSFVCVTLAAALAVSGLPSCAGASAEDRERPDPGLRELEEPPDSAEGRVVALPKKGSLTKRQRKVLERHGLTPSSYADLLSALGIPRGGFVMTPGKARAAADLRLYAEELYADASYNMEVGRMAREAMWSEIVRLGEELGRHRTWWQRNVGRIGMVGGWILGAGTTLLVVYGVRTAAP